MWLLDKLMEPCRRSKLRVEISLKKLMGREVKEDLEQPEELKEIVIDKGEYEAASGSETPPPFYRNNSFFNPPVMTNDLREKLAQAGDKEVYNIALNGKIW
jgi:CO dehydrogenase/acetyl-CoA synthase gamma subunit (corrinoid Fe-S protein)